jgi:phage FluMu protein Com
MKEIRCRICGRLLFKKEGDLDTIEIKCPRCGYVQKVETKKEVKKK